MASGHGVSVGSDSRCRSCRSVWVKSLRPAPSRMTTAATDDSTQVLVLCTASRKLTLARSQ
jgi:hypothetical protein